MVDTLVNVIYSAFKSLPFMNSVSRETIKNGILRTKYLLPFSLDRKHSVEGLLRKVIFLNYFFTAIFLSAYFWYVNFYSTQGVTLQAGLIPLVINWIVTTFFSKKFHEIYLDNKREKTSSVTFPYIYNSFLAGWIAFAFFLLGASMLDNIQSNYSGELRFQFFFLIILFNYTAHTFTTEMNIVFVQHDIFHPKWIKAFWICAFIYLIYQNIDFLLRISHV